MGRHAAKPPKYRNYQTAKNNSSAWQGPWNGNWNTGQGGHDWKCNGDSDGWEKGGKTKSWHGKWWDHDQEEVWSAADNTCTTTRHHEWPSSKAQYGVKNKFGEWEKGKHCSSESASRDEHFAHDQAIESESEFDTSAAATRHLVAIKNYLESIAFDSFSAQAMKLSVDVEPVGDSFTASLYMPPACPLRGTYRSAKCATEQAARRKVLAKVVEDLKKEDLLDDQLRPTKVQAPAQPSTISWPLPCPGPMPLQFLNISNLHGVPEWPKSMVLTHITLLPDQHGWTSFGCLSAHACPGETPGFALQFELGQGLVAKTEPTVIPWPPSAAATAHIQAYCHQILPEGPDTLAVVPLIRGSIDWGRICGVSSEGHQERPPDWLLLLCQRVVSLQRLERLGSLCAPIGPVPNPLRMEAVLGGGFGWGAQAFQVLCLLGEKSLKMLFAVSHFVEHPYDDARRLEERMEAAMLPDRLASLVANSGLLAEVIQAADGTPWLPRLDDVDFEIAERILKALVGAYVGETGGDFYSVVKLWEWLTADELKATVAGDEPTSPYINELKSSTRYLDLEATKYKARTPTYENFKQVQAADGTLELHVDYEDLGLVFYRRPEVSKKLPHGQYMLKRDQDAGHTEWSVVQYDHRQKTYVCRAFQPQDSQNQMIPAALPNKVQRWIRGTHASSLINYKRSEVPTLVYVSLREMRDGSLRVLYKNRGWCCYRRCPKGGLGFEWVVKEGEERKQTLFYSEKPGEKTLFSPNHEEEPLPNKVTEWFLTGKSLIELVSIVATNAGKDVQVSEPESDCIAWESNEGEPWICRREYVDCAIVYAAGKVDDSKPLALQLEELVYHGQTCASQDTVMPDKVIKWIKKHPERSCDEKVFKAYTEQQSRKGMTLFTPAPLQMQAQFPQLAHTCLGHLEKALQHNFSNRMLLAEALLQTSGKVDSLTPDFQRLAYVGNAVAEQLVTRILVESAQFSTAATRSHHDKPVNASTFAVGPNAALQAINNTPKYDWPLDGGLAAYTAEWPMIDNVDLNGPDDLERMRQACCNNVAYARIGMSEVLRTIN